MTKSQLLIGKDQQGHKKHKMTTKIVEGMELLSCEERPEKSAGCVIEILKILRSEDEYITCSQP